MNLLFDSWNRLLSALTGPSDSTAVVIVVLIAPLAVAFFAGFITNRWQSRLIWLTAEYERRVLYYERLSEAASDLSLGLGQIVQLHAERGNSKGSRPAAKSLGSFGATYEVLTSEEGSAEIAGSVNSWRRQAAKAGMLASGYAATFIRNSDDELSAILKAVVDGENFDIVATHGELVFTSLQRTLSALNLDMLRLRHFTIGALPWKQRREEKRALMAEVASINRTIEEADVIIYRLTQSIYGTTNDITPDHKDD